MRRPGPDRRRMLGLCAAALLASGRSAGAAQERVAVIDWGIFETLLAIGVTPLAATELRQFREIAVEPAIPAGVADLGLRGTPNYELLLTIAPDLILISGFYEYQRAALERIAAVEDFPIYEAGTPPFAIAEATALRLGERLGKAAEARRYVEETHIDLAARRVSLERLAGRPFFVISLGDARHFRAFGADSMFGDVLARMGLHNAWTDPTSYSAAAPVGIEALALAPEAAIVIVEPLPAEVALSLPDNALWNALPAVREGRVALLDPVNHFGGLPSARRFARLLTDATASWTVGDG